MAHLRFLIPALPPGTPPGTLFLTGEHRGWISNPEGWTFDQSGEGAMLDAELAAGTLLSVKVRLQLPDGHILEEGDAWGGRAPAHTVTVQEQGGVVTLNLEGWQDDREGKGRPSQSRPPRMEWNLTAPWGEQTVRLWWPEGHDGRDLPLLVMHDGQNVFDEVPSFSGQSWRAADAAQARAEAGYPCLIAALSVNAERSRRYVPFAFRLNEFKPGADEYLDWIETGLLPALEDAFGPVPPECRALAGSSFGGLVTLYGGLRRPDVFGTLGVFSPAIWPDDFALLRWMEGRAAPHMRVWLDMGDHEAHTVAEAAEVVHLTHELGAGLQPRVAQVQVTIAEGHWHDEAAWAARFPAFLTWWLSGLASAHSAAQ
ncbi:alpha/beta hydrolase-fold protein [Deinococcus deserti]|uniref:Putative esterase n=1 Tax=Deinococcus deserti (strain DSM 17065 / CIP 109153 / LMG 22923 / VCD115) TaxID=546414 RepID=C1CY72_DEIDV|nr:alpha/beta hydrolase-fold protein [Deinococcus deserti]ACO47028.1 putative esterase [Deinococcus deserti VCD115]